MGTLMSLVVIGGLGFMVTSEIYYNRDIKHLSTHSKLVFITHLGLFLLGAIVFFILESTQAGILANEDFADGMLISFFQSVSARTAGFNSIDLSKIKDSSAILIMSL